MIPSVGPPDLVSLCVCRGGWFGGVCFVWCVLVDVGLSFCFVCFFVVACVCMCFQEMAIS